MPGLFVPLKIMALKITPGNTADSAVLEEITQHLTGKLYADKGYIGRELFNKLWQRGLHLITGIRRTRSRCKQRTWDTPASWFALFRNWPLL